MKAIKSSERQYLNDSTTNRRIIQWTDSDFNDQHLYFTSPSVTADGRYMVIISERNGAPNLYVIDRENGSIRRLSDANGLLRAYVYPTGSEYGFSKSSPVLDAIRQKVYWVQDDAVWMRGLEVKDKPQLLANLPEGWWTAYTSLSPDGATLCVSCTDPRAFSSEDFTQHDQLREVPWRMLKENLYTRLYIIDTITGKSSVLAEVPFWVTHLQFDPNGSGRIIINSEGTVGSSALRKFPYWGRVWRVDPDGSWSRLYEQQQGETVNHENWFPDGSCIIYHGNRCISINQKIRRLTYRVLRKARLVTLEKELRSRYHFVEARNWNGDLVFHEKVDISVSHAIATSGSRGFMIDSRDGNIYLYQQLDNGKFQCEILCIHGSSMIIQDAHPHPIMSPDRKSVIFTSNLKGTCNVYEVVIEER